MYICFSDINECMEGINYCADLCINGVGSYTCACNNTGYILNEDGYKCDGKCLTRFIFVCMHASNNTLCISYTRWLDYKVAWILSWWCAPLVFPI